MSNPFEVISEQLTRIENKLGYMDQFIHQSSVKVEPSAASKRFLTPAQAGEKLNLSTQTIYGKIHRKELPFHKPDGCKRVYFLESELDQFIASGRVKTSSENVNESEQLTSGAAAPPQVKRKIVRRNRMSKVKK